jgi:lipopolysaccharide export system permease protein
MSNLRIHRYILREISAPTILSLLIFTFVLLMGKIPKLTELVINKGVPATEILQLFSYLLPTFFSITVPLSFLLGILLTFGRFSADNEFVALKASGISLYSLIKPVLFLAFLFTLLTAWLTISIEPASKTAFREKLFRIASSSAGVSIKPGVFNDKFDGIVLYTQGMD